MRLGYSISSMVFFSSNEIVSRVFSYFFSFIKIVCEKFSTITTSLKKKKKDTRKNHLSYFAKKYFCSIYTLINFGPITKKKKNKLSSPVTMQKKILKKNWSHITLLWKKRKKKRVVIAESMYIYIYLSTIYVTRSLLPR